MYVTYTNHVDNILLIFIGAVDYNKISTSCLISIFKFIEQELLYLILLSFYLLFKYSSHFSLDNY